MIALWYWSSFFFVTICLQHLVSVSHSSIPIEHKTAGLQLLLDLQETFLHFIYDNPFNYATSDRVSVLLRQRNIRKILKSQAKSRKMPQNIRETECRKKKKCKIECVYLWLDLCRSQPFISLACKWSQAQNRTLLNSVHWNLVRLHFHVNGGIVFSFSLFLAIHSLYLILDCYL